MHFLLCTYRYINMVFVCCLKKNLQMLKIRFADPGRYPILLNMQGVPIDILPFATCVLDTSGLIKGVNEKFARLLEYDKPENFAGLPLRELMEEASWRRITQHMAICVSRGDADSSPQKILLFNSQDELVEVHCTVSYRKTYDRVLLHIVPVIRSDEEGLEKNLKNRFSDAVITILDTRTLMKRLLSILSDVSGLEMGSVFVRDPIDNILKLGTSTGMKEEFIRIISQAAVSQWGTAVSKVLFFSRQLEDVSIPPLLRKHGVSAALFIPVVEKETLRVMYALFSRSRGTYTQSERKNITEAAKLLRTITIRMLREQNLESGEHLYRSLIRSMPNGVLVRNRRGAIIHYNLVAARTFGQRNDTTLSPDILFEGTSFYTEENTPLSRSDLPGMVSLREGRKIRNSEIRVQRRDGSSVWLSVNSEPLFGQENNLPFAVVSTFKDVSITRRIREELEKAKEEAVEANRSKGSFLANVSHEIRTPLSGIMGMTDILLGSLLNTEQHRQLEMMKEAEENLLDIVNKVLELSKIESGTLLMEYRPFQLKECIEKAVSPLCIGMKRTQIELQIDVESQIPETVLGDSKSLRQILINLMGNAVKFTEEGHIRIRVKLYDKMKGNKVPLLFSVQDTGIGISRDEQARIFHIFQQVDSSYSKKHQGTGLGLTISKQLIDLMGGTLWLVSKPGEGSTFYFSLDLGIPSEKEMKFNIQPEPKIFRSSTPLHILLAEDNPLNQESIAYYLQKMGHSSEIVENGKEAIQALQRRAFDLILMDIQMPVLNGLETTLQIRSGRLSSIRQDIPILALTAYSMKSEIDRVYSAGMNGYIPKPIDRNFLFHTIEKTISRSSEYEEAYEKKYENPQLLRLEEDLKKDIDLTAFAEDYRTDVAVAKRLLQLFIHDVPGRIRGMEAALHGKKSKQLADCFHSLVNNLSAVRLFGLGKSMREMEKQALEGNFHYIADKSGEIKADLLQVLDEADRYLRILNMIEEN